jgi:hypothetical protein
MSKNKNVNESVSEPMAEETKVEETKTEVIAEPTTDAPIVDTLGASLKPKTTTTTNNNERMVIAIGGKGDKRYIDAFESHGKTIGENGFSNSNATTLKFLIAYANKNKAGFTDYIKSLK